LIQNDNIEVLAMKYFGTIVLFVTFIIAACSNNSQTEVKNDGAGFASVNDTSINYNGKDQRSLFLKTYYKNLEHFKSKEFKEEVSRLVENMDPKITEWTNDKLTKSQMMEKAFMELENLYINYDKNTARKFGFYDYSRYAEVGKNLMGDPEYNELINKIIILKDEIKYYFESLMTAKLSVVPGN
jgi:hypothetical protein